MQDAIATLPSTNSPHPRKWLCLAVLCLVSVSASIDRNVIGLLLEPIKTEFGASDTQLGLLTGIAFSALFATIGIPVARWSDTGDRRKVITAAAVVWSLMTALCGTAQNFTQLLLYRIGVGAGEAGSTPPVQSLIGDYFPVSQRGRAISIYLLATLLAGVLVSIVGAWIAQHHGWRATLYAVGLTGIPISALAWLTLDEPRRRTGYPARSQSSAWHTVRALLQKRAYLLILAGSVFYYMLAYGALAFLPLFLMRVHQASLTQVGAMVGLATAAGSVFGSLAGGAVTDRLAQRNTVWLTMIPTLGMMLACPVFVTSFLTRDLKLCLAMLGVGYFLLSALVPALMSGIHVVCGSTRRAMAFALFAFFGNLIGAGLGPVVTGMASDYWTRALGPVGGLRYALTAMMALFVLAAVLIGMASHWIRAETEA